MSVKALVDTAIKNEFIIAWSKQSCPFCTRAKTLLGGLSLPAGKSVKVFELDTMENGADIQAYLADKTGQRTVPNIFIKGQHIGGSDDLTKAKASGKLAELIKA